MNRTEEEILAAISSAPYETEGQVAYLVAKPEPGVHTPLESATVVEGFGFAGDHVLKSHWRGALIPGRDVSAISIEALRAMGADPVVPGDNLVTRGINLAALQEGDRLEIGDVVLERGPKPHRPCDLFRRRLGQEAFRAAAAGWRGALFVARAGGVIHVGQTIRVVPAHVVAS